MAGVRSVVRRVTAGAASPVDFGAVGDGVADDTAAVNRCLAQSRTVDFGGPDRAYLVTGTLVAQQTSVQVLAGTGATVRAGVAGLVLLRLATAGHTVAGLVFAGHPGFGGTGIRVEAPDTLIEGCSFEDLAGSGVSVQSGAHRAKVTSCVFQRCGHRPATEQIARYAVAVGAANHCAVRDNELIDVAGGVRFEATAPSWVDFPACRGNAITGGPGAVAHGVSVVRGRNGKITENTIDAVNGANIDCVACTDTVVAGNVTDGGTDGVTIGGVGSHSVTVTGNTLRHAQRGIRVYTDGTQGLMAGVVVRGNTIARPVDAGIRVDEAAGTQLAGVLIADNAIDLQGAGDYGITIRNGETARIVGNRIFRARRDGIRLESTDIVQVTGNILQDAGFGSQQSYDAVAVTDSSRVLVRDTFVYGGARHAVHIQGGTNNTIAGNRWRGTSTIGIKDRSNLTVLDDNVEFNLAQSDRVRVMPLGDSITDGMEHRGVPGAYRTELWRLLTTNGHRVDFVGSRANGPDSLGDLDHEGHEGWRIAQVHDRIMPWLQLTRPHVVLLHIGTNDLGDPQVAVGASDRLAALVDRIFGVVPDVHLVLAQIINRTNSPSYEQRVLAYNAAAVEIVNTHRSAGRRAYRVNMFPVVTSADFADGTHPNAEGYRKMAATWYAAMTSDPSILNR